jgi:hypothetical protein
MIGGGPLECGHCRLRPPREFLICFLVAQMNSVVSLVCYAGVALEFLHIPLIYGEIVGEIFDSFESIPMGNSEMRRSDTLTHFRASRALHNVQLSAPPNRLARVPPRGFLGLT